MSFNTLRLNKENNLYNYIYAIKQTVNVNVLTFNQLENRVIFFYLSTLHQTEMFHDVYLYKKNELKYIISG